MEGRDRGERLLGMKKPLALVLLDSTAASEGKEDKYRDFVREGRKSKSSHERKFDGYKYRLRIERDIHGLDGKGYLSPNVPLITDNRILPSPSNFLSMNIK